jgi:hypothetical protein
MAAATHQCNDYRSLPSITAYGLTTDGSWRRAAWLLTGDIGLAIRVGRLGGIEMRLQGLGNLSLDDSLLRLVNRLLIGLQRPANSL